MSECQLAMDHWKLGMGYLDLVLRFMEEIFLQTSSSSQLVLSVFPCPNLPVMTTEASVLSDHDSLQS